MRRRLSWCYMSCVNNQRSSHFQFFSFACRTFDNALNRLQLCIGIKKIKFNAFVGINNFIAPSYLVLPFFFCHKSSVGKMPHNNAIKRTSRLLQGYTSRLIRAKYFSDFSLSACVVYISTRSFTSPSLSASSDRFLRPAAMISALGFTQQILLCFVVAALAKRTVSFIGIYCIFFTSPSRVIALAAYLQRARIIACIPCGMCALRHRSAFSFRPCIHATTLATYFIDPLFIPASNSSLRMLRLPCFVAR